MKIFARIVMIVAFALGTVVATGCNTTRGVGEDVEAAGEGIQDAAN